MQVSVENVGALERKLTVRIPAERMESRVRERISELGRTVRLKGFRPGKIPAKVLEQRFGEQVRSEALGEIVRSSFEEAVRQQNLRVAASPSIQTRREAADIEYTATFEVVPELGAIDFAGMEFERADAEVGEADVDRMIETLRQQRREWTPVERGAGPGDMVLIEYSATTADGRHPTIGRERIGTLLGSNALGEGFERELAGLAAGADKSFEVDFPAGFREAALAGKRARIELSVVRVQETKLPELDEAFVASFGIREGGLAKFRADVRANLERELANALRARRKRDVVEKLTAHYADVDLPRGMVESESRALLAQARQQAERAGAKAPESTEPFQAVSRRRVLAFLLLNEIARQNQITPDRERVSAALAAIASTYEDPQQVVALYARDAELMNSLRNAVLEDQVVEWVLDHAKTRAVSLSFDEAIKPPQA